MKKKKTIRIDRERAIMLLKEISTEVYPCSVHDEYYIYEYSDKCISHYLENNNTDIGCYITDNYEYGLLELIHFIRDNTLDSDKLHIAQQLLSALAEYGYENDSYVEQNKKEILFRLYDNEDIFRNALLSYMNPLMMRHYHYLELAREGMKDMAQLQPLVEKIAAQVLWVDTESLPNILEFEYIFPNGKQGDIIKYIFDEYGENSKVSGLIWNGKVEKEFVFMFDMLYPISESCGYKIKTASDDPKFFDVFKHHVPTMIEDKLTELIIDRKINIFNDKAFRKIQAIVFDYRKVQKQRRTEIYSQLVLQEKTSPKWKTEAQLFALVSSIYPDAIYQYRTDWLRRQSLDIFIPSHKIGIEYQGRQHYEPIEHFGGEEHFIHQQENDSKKRKLCEDNGVSLIEWPYTEDITETNLIKHLSKAQSKNEE